MSRTTRDADEAAEARTDDAAETTEAARGEEAEQAAARPAKRKRRVRVIEVIDDEDLDEVLEALDSEESEEAEESEDVDEEPEEPPAKAAKKPKPRPARLEPPKEEADEADEDDEPAKAKAKPSLRKPAAASDAVSVEPTYLGMRRTPLIVVVVLVALIASLAIWQWRSASTASSEADERAAVQEVAAAYGNVAVNYNASNYEAQMEKAKKLMGGDLLETYKSTPKTLAEIFKKYPEAQFSSETRETFVGSLNGRLATAVVAVDVSIKSQGQTVDQPATLLRLSLGKFDGEWKVTQQYASGVDESNQGQGGQLPAGTQSGAPNGSESSGGEQTEKPKN